VNELFRPVSGLTAGWLKQHGSLPIQRQWFDPSQSKALCCFTVAGAALDFHQIPVSPSNVDHILWAPEKRGVSVAGTVIKSIEIQTSPIVVQGRKQLDEVRSFRCLAYNSPINFNGKKRELCLHLILFQKLI
jgi:hypothetical protein